ncbi:MAG: hypothetical protein WBA97_28145 [Actinophytocola sp.]|uniref:hypothetical protein n=1 Tax=Actinophytocola sp. TaxID=1872138 RepID=UPI003C74D605
MTFRGPRLVEYASESARQGPDVSERAFDLVYRVCRLVGRPEASSARLARRILREFDSTARGRRARDTYVHAINERLARRVHARDLDNALRAAILCDEMTLLPPRQRLALSSVVLDGSSVAQIAQRTGWSTTQTARLLRSALVTLSARESATVSR